MRQSEKFADETGLCGSASGVISERTTSRSGSTNPNGRNSTASTTVNIALLAPMPSASVSTTASVNPGLLRSERAA